jgi:hypothetical protein
MNRTISRAVKGVGATLVAAAAVLTVSAPAQAAPAPHHHVTVAAQVAPVVRTGVLKSNGVRPNLAWKSYTWNAIFTGDCVMQQGATWTLYSDGTASFDGTVGSSDGGDAWLMWMHLRDANGAELGLIQNYALPDPNNIYKFVQNLPNAGWQYRWFAGGTFPAWWFNYVATMSLESHC